MAWGTVVMYMGFLWVKKFHLDLTCRNLYPSRWWQKPATKGVGFSSRDGQTHQVWLKGDCLYTNSLYSHCTPNMPKCHLTHPSKPQPLPSHPMPIGRQVDSSSGWVDETRDEVGLGVRKMGWGWVDRTGGEVAWSMSGGCCWLMEDRACLGVSACHWLADVGRGGWKRGCSCPACHRALTWWKGWVENHCCDISKVVGGGWSAYCCDMARRVRRVAVHLVVVTWQM